MAIPVFSFGQTKYKLPPYAAVTLMNDPHNDEDQFEVNTEIGLIPAGDTIELIGYDGGVWIVKHQGRTGSILPAFIDETRPHIAALQKELLAKATKDAEIKRSKKVTVLAKRFGKTAAEGILDGRIWIGMTEEMALESIGKPQRVNRTTNKYGVSEQWVYRSQYLYFMNGKLETYQDNNNN